MNVIARQSFSILKFCFGLIAFYAAAVLIMVIVVLVLRGLFGFEFSHTD